MENFLWCGAFEEKLLPVSNKGKIDKKHLKNKLHFQFSIF